MRRLEVTGRRRIVQAVGVLAILVTGTGVWVGDGLRFSESAREAVEATGFQQTPLAVQFADRAAGVRTLLPTGDDRAAMETVVRRDWVFIIAYVTLLLAVAGLLRWRPFRFGWLLSVLAIVAILSTAFLDVLENLAILDAIRSGEGAGPGVFAVTKWLAAFLALGLLSVAFLGPLKSVALTGWMLLAAALGGLGVVGLALLGWGSLHLLWVPGIPLGLGMLLLILLAAGAPDVVLRQIEMPLRRGTRS